MEDGWELAQDFLGEEGELGFGFGCFFAVEFDFAVGWLDTHWFVETQEDISEGL